MTDTQFNFINGPWLHARFSACIRTTDELILLGELSDPVAGLRLCRAEAETRIAAGLGSNIISVEVLDARGEIVLGELADRIAESTADGDVP